MARLRHIRLHHAHWICVALAAITIAAYWPVLDAGFVGFDDDLYVTDNHHVQAGLTWTSLPWAFTTLTSANWHPLTWLSHMLDAQLYGMNPLGHHLTNLILHIANVLLLFVLLDRLTGYRWRSALVAALFAVHPLHVESVAWVAERKDVLSTLFWLLTTWAYVAYAGRPSMRRYALVIAAFTLGLMAKPMLVTLPLTLLLLDYWPLGRLQVIGYRLQGEACSDQPPAPKTQHRARLVIEKMPLFALALASCIITFVAQSRGGAVGTLQIIPLGVRIDNAAVSCVKYLAKMIWPRDLAVMYLHPLNSLPVWQVVGSFALVAAVTVAVVLARRSRPYLLVGWLWYLITLMPVIGVVQVGVQAMADRYTYVPLIGIFVAVVWLLGELVGNHELRITSHGVRVASCGVAVGVVAALAACTWDQVGFWHDGVTLFEHSTRVCPSSLAHTNLGSILEEDGQWEAARQHYEEALRLQPDCPEALFNYGVLLGKSGDVDGAISLYRRVLRIRPTHVEAHYNLGLIYDDRKRIGAAIREYEATLFLAPDYASAHNNLAIAFYSTGRYEQAWRHVHAAQALGFRPHPGFLEALSSKMPEPAR